MATFTKYEKDIVEHFKIDKDMQKLINAANYDLYMGPSEVNEEYPGFQKACDTIKTALDDVTDVYVDEMSEEVLTKEPEAEIVDGEEIEPTPYYYFNRKEVLKALVGEELVSYIL